MTEPSNPSQPNLLLEWRKAICDDETLAPMSKLILYTLSMYMNVKTGTSWPSMFTLRQKANVSKSTVIRALKNIEELGWVRIERGNSSRSNRYYPCIPQNKKS